jgi:hypothetical protein
MQHQLFVVRHKIHVHKIPKFATVDSKVQECTMLQRHDRMFYTQWRSYLEVVTNKLDAGGNYLLEVGGLESSLMGWQLSVGTSQVKCLQLATQTSFLK